MSLVKHVDDDDAGVANVTIRGTSERRHVEYRVSMRREEGRWRIRAIDVLTEHHPD